MKKALTLILALALTLALAGCDSMPGSSAAGSGDGYPDKDGFADGYIGTTMHTDFFDFTVNSAELAAEYEGYAPTDGNELLISELTIKNTFNESIPMFDTDFQAQWGEEGEDDFAYPIEEIVNDSQLPAEYDLAVQEERTGILVFEVPAGYKDFSISYKVYYDDDTTGDTFFVYFTPDAPAAV